MQRRANQSTITKPSIDPQLWARVQLLLNGHLNRLKLGLGGLWTLAAGSTALSVPALFQPAEGSLQAVDFLTWATSSLPCLGTLGLAAGASYAYWQYCQGLLTQQQTNAAQAASNYDSYRITRGAGKEIAHEAMVQVYLAIHGILQADEKTRLKGGAVTIRLAYVGNKDEGKCMYLQVPGGNIELIESLRATLRQLDSSIQVLWADSLPLQLKDDDAAGRLKVLYQGVQLTKANHLFINKDWKGVKNPLGVLVSLLNVNQEMPLAGVFIELRAAGTEWLAEGRLAVARTKAVQAQVKVGLRDKGLQQNLNEQEQSLVEADGMGFETSMMIFAAALSEQKARSQVGAILSTWLSKYRKQGGNSFGPSGQAIVTNLAGLHQKLAAGTVWGLYHAKIATLAPSEIAGVGWIPPFEACLSDGWAVSGSQVLPALSEMVVGKARRMPRGRAPQNRLRLVKKPTVGKSRWRYKQVQLGYNNEQNGWFTQIGMYLVDIIRHLHVLGITGSGKTTFLINLLLACIYQKIGVTYIEPHGDIRKVLERIPRKLEREVVWIDPPAQHAMGMSISINIMKTKPDKSDLPQVLSYLMGVFGKLIDFGSSPRTRIVIETSLKVLLQTVAQPTLHEFWQFLHNTDYRNELIAQAPAGYSTSWQEKLLDLDEKKLEEVLGPSYTRVLSFLNNPYIAAILTNPESTIDFRELMDERKIILITLPEANTDYAMSILGSMLFGRIRMDAFSRRDIAEEDRVLHIVQIDEFGTFSDLEPEAIEDVFASIRKYNVSFIVAHQLLRQLGALVTAVLGNTGTKVVFACSNDDGSKMADVLGMGLTGDDLVSLPMGYAYIKPMVKESKRRTMMMQTYPPTELLAEQLRPADLEAGWQWVEQQGHSRRSVEGYRSMAGWLDRNPGAVPDRVERIQLLSSLRYCMPANDRFSQGVSQGANEVETDDEEVVRQAVQRRGYKGLYIPPLSPLSC